MKSYKATQVFVPGGMPQHTYVNRAERDLEGRLKAVSDNLCKLVTLTGATKSGKTVLVNRLFPRTTGENIWIDGGAISAENDLWSAVLSALEGYTSEERSDTSESTATLSGEAEGEASIPLVAKAKGKVGGSTSQKAAKSVKRSRQVSPRTAAIALMRSAGSPLIIDDFHYLERSFQGDVIRALKPLVFEGYPVVIIAIPHRRYDAVKVEREMTGRLESIQVPVWNSTELSQIPEVGFALLNVKLDPGLSARLAAEAYGSPHLMQDFCRGLCTAHGVTETVQGTGLRIRDVKDDLFRSIAEGTGKVVFDKLAKGPRQRSDRMARPLAGGGTADIYRVVLLALAKLAPGMQKVDYESLRARIRELLSGDIPQAHEVSRVLDKMSEIASSDEASTPVIDWDKDDQELHITDPFFAFFLKWGALQA